MTRMRMGCRANAAPHPLTPESTNRGRLDEADRRGDTTEQEEDVNMDHEQKRGALDVAVAEPHEVEREPALTGEQIGRVAELIGQLADRELGRLQFLSNAAAALGITTAHVAAKEALVKVRGVVRERELDVSASLVEDALDHVPELLDAIAEARFDGAWGVAQSLRDTIRDELANEGIDAFHCPKCEEAFPWSECAEAKDDEEPICIRCASADKVTA